MRAADIRHGTEIKFTSLRGQSMAIRANDRNLVTVPLVYEHTTGTGVTYLAVVGYRIRIAGDRSSFGSRHVYTFRAETASELPPLTAAS